MPERAMTSWLKEKGEKPEMPGAKERPLERRVEQTRGLGKTIDRDGRDREKQWRRSNRGTTGNEVAGDIWGSAKVGAMGAESNTKVVQAMEGKTPSPFTKGISYSKTCVVRITMPGSGSPPLEGLAVLDDQSTISMVNPWVADWFRIKRQEMPIVKYKMSTMERKDAPHESRILHGMEVEPLINPGEKGNAGKMELPSCIESKNIPEALGEIPDREGVR